MQREKFKDYNLKYNKGIAAISSILVIITLTLFIGLSAATSGITEGILSQSQKESQESYFIAESGVYDAIIRIARNKNYSSGGYFIPLGCVLNSSGRCSKVIVEKNAQTLCSQVISFGKSCIISIGTINNKSKTVEVILNVNAVNGKIDIVSWKEI
ncbi:MAG: pilus assembly PilX N-terminal domain-containing protein [Patescibacteria group bacterium]